MTKKSSRCVCGEGSDSDERWSLRCLGQAGCLKVKERFTVHGMRRTFVDLSRRARVDPVVTRSLTGHVTMKMHMHYSSVALDEKRAAVAAIAALI